MNLESTVSLMVSTLLWIAVLGFVLAARRRSKDDRVAWGICLSAALLFMLHVTQVWVPEVGRTRTLFKPAAEVTQWLSDADQPVATLAHEWPEVAFYTRRNDIRNFKGTASKALSEFVAEHPRTVIVASGRQDLGGLKNSLPKGIQLTVVEQLANARIMLAEREPNVRTASSAVQELER